MNSHPLQGNFSLILRIFDKDRKGYITEEDLISTASRLFLVNNNQNQGSQARNLNAFR